MRRRRAAAVAAVAKDNARTTRAVSAKPAAGRAVPGRPWPAIVVAAVTIRTRARVTNAIFVVAD